MRKLPNLLVIFCFIFCFPPISTADISPIAWNTAFLSPAPPNIKQRIEEGLSDIYSISYEDIPKTLEIVFVGVQDDRILIQFERTPRRMTNLCVFDVQGNYLYGYRLFIRHNDTRLALSPNRDGILILDWRVAKIGYPGVLVLSSDQKAEYYYYRSQTASDDFSVWNSDYQLVSHRNGRVIIANSLTNEEQIIVDHSKEYAFAHPNQSQGSSTPGFLFLAFIVIVCLGSIGLPILMNRLWKN